MTTLIPLWLRKQLRGTSSQAPSIVRLTDDGRVNRTLDVKVGLNNGERWVVARGFGLDTLKNRVHCAWLVFTGKADALIWPEDEA